MEIRIFNIFKKIISKMIKTKLKDLFLIKNIAHKDYRGYFKELIRENKLGKKFPFLVMSFSKKGVIRGMHLQTKNHKENLYQ